MTEKLVTIAEYGTSENAHMAKIVLAQNDIESIVVGDNLLMAAPKIGIPKVEVKVFEKDAELAKKILESWEKREV
jgi:hypothetical protein